MSQTWQAFPQRSKIVSTQVTQLVDVPRRMIACYKYTCRKKERDRVLEVYKSLIRNSIIMHRGPGGVYRTMHDHAIHGIA